MAYSKSHLQEIAEDLECDICLYKFEDPRVLICQHIYCASCLSRLADGGSIITCPGCRKETLLDWSKGVLGLPKPILLNKVQAKLSSLMDSPMKQDELTEKKLKLCGPCSDVKLEKAAETYCKDCLCAMCNNCAEKHENLEGHDNHKLSDIKNYTNCVHHPMNINNMYCIDCKVALCWKCVIGKHKLHSVKELHEIIPEQLKQLEQKATSIDKKLEGISAKLSENQNLTDLVSGSIVDARKGVMKWCDDMSSKIGTVADKLLSELENRQDRINEDLIADKTSLKEVEEKFLAQKKEIACTMDCGSEITILNFNKEFLVPKIDIKSVVPNFELPIITSNSDIDLDSLCQLEWKVQSKEDKLSSVTSPGDQDLCATVEKETETVWSGFVHTQLYVEPTESPRRWTHAQTYSHDAHNITDMIRHPNQDKFYVRLPKKSFPRAFSIVNMESGSDNLISLPNYHQWNYKDTGLAFDSNRHIVVVGQYPRSVFLFDEDGDFMRKVAIRGDIDDVERLVYCENFGVYAVTDSALNCVHIIDEYTFEIIRSIKSTGSEPFAHPQFISFDESTGLLAITDRETRDIRLLEISGREVRRVKNSAIMHRPNGLCFSPGGDLYVCNSESHYLGVVKILKGTDNTEVCLGQSDLGSRSPYVLSMISDTKMVVSGSPCMLSYFNYM